MDEKYAKHLLEKGRQDYDRISEHFSRTRSFLWKELKYLTGFCHAGERILDLGCGNGRLSELFKERNIDYIGADNSEKLIEIAKKKYPKERFFKASALNLPFPTNYFDKIFSIAVLHHIPSAKLRLRFLKEAKRVLKPGGLLIFTVWNLYQRKFFKYHLKYTLSKIIGKSTLQQVQGCPEFCRRAALDFRDIFYPWKNQKGKVLTQRYFHCFRIKELRNLTKKSGLEIKEIGFLEKEKRNIYLVAQKA